MHWTGSWDRHSWRSSDAAARHMAVVVVYCVHMQCLSVCACVACGVQSCRVLGESVPKSLFRDYGCVLRLAPRMHASLCKTMPHVSMCSRIDCTGTCPPQVSPHHNAPRALVFPTKGLGVSLHCLSDTCPGVKQ